jgi:hypothetical protein
VLGGVVLLVAFFVTQLAASRLRLPPVVFHLVWPLQCALLTLCAWLCIELGPSGIPDFIYARY